MKGKSLTIAEQAVFADNSETSQKVYDEWSKAYDEDLKKLGHTGPAEVLKMFAKYAKTPETILDLGAGTGKLAELLRHEYKYNGDLDLLDANLNMLVVAETKGLRLRNIIRHFVNDDGALPLREEVYDVITAASCFVTKHIPPTSLPGIIKSLKRGGLMVFDMRVNTIPEYRACFDGILQTLVDEKKVELLDQSETSHFADSDHCEEMAQVRIIRRL